MSLIELTAVELLGELKAGNVSAAELAEAYLERIEQTNDKIGAFLRIDRRAVLEQAEQIDRRRRRGERLGPLAGLPVAVKDNLCVRGELTTCASRILAGFRPPYDATVIRRLRQADAVLLGRTNMDEFAMGGSNENSAFGLVRNPWDLERIPGGSSGGFGLVAFASSLDQIGPLAWTVEDVSLLLETLAGHDPQDSTSVDRPVPAYSRSVGQALEGLRLGVVREHFDAGLDAEVEAAVREALRVYESLGAQVREVSLPHSRYAVATYYIIAPCEASSNLARYDGVHYGYRTDEKQMLAELEAQRRKLQAAGDEAGLAELDSALVRMYRRTRSEGFGAEVKRRIMLGTYALSAGYYDAYYLKALKVRRLIREDFDRAFGEVDLIAGPVTPSPAYKLGQRLDDPLSMYLFDLYTVSTNLAGLPGISIPCGFSREGLPIGLHLQAPPFEEERLLRGARMFQQATDWHRRRPRV